jgi:hypothetical protein
MILQRKFEHPGQAAVIVRVRCTPGTLAFPDFAR